MTKFSEKDTSNYLLFVHSPVNKFYGFLCFFRSILTLLLSQYVAIKTLVHLLCSDGKIILTATVSSARRWYIRLGLPKSNIYLVIVVKCHKLADTGRSCLAVYHASYNALVIALNHNMKNIWVYLRLCPCYKCITRNGFDPWLKTKHIVLANQVYKHIHLASSRHSISTRKNIQTMKFYYHLIWMTSLVKNKILDLRNKR